MKQKIIINLLSVLLLLMWSTSPLVAANYYRPDGKQIDNVEYEKIVNQRSSKIRAIQIGGYGGDEADFKDPVLLRKKRIEPWKLFRGER
jgi:hypothetical protein